MQLMEQKRFDCKVVCLASLIPKDLKYKKNYLMFNIHKNTEVYISTITIRVETR